MPRMPKKRAPVQDKKVALESFDLNLLRTLDALLATRSVSRAAQSLGLSQPATSAALARLRQHLGDPILVRSGNQMAATAVAEEIRPRIARILEDVRDALVAAATFEPARTTRRFRIGANDYATQVLLAPLARRLREEAPNAILEILPCDITPEVSLMTREFDLAVSDRWGLRDIRGVETLFHESFVCIARAGHPRLSRRPTLKQFLAEDHALISARGVLPGNVDDALEASGLTRKVALTVPHYLVAPTVVAHTDLILTLPRRVAGLFARNRQLRTFMPPFSLKGFDVVMASHPRSAREPSIQWLMQLLRDVARTVQRA
jgi:DNA-binding transcriptional LysR family regulator